jgi:5-deoxy-D-glucuronate isomerase
MQGDLSMNNGSEALEVAVEDHSGDSHGLAERVTYRVRMEGVEGFTSVLTPQNALLNELSVGRLRLDARRGAYVANTTNRETILHILVGQCTLEARGSWGQVTFRDLGERRDVFSGLPTSVVLSPFTEYTVIPTTPSFDAAIGSLPIGGNQERSPTVIRPQDVQVHQIGERHFSRTVREVLGGDGPALRMRVGETLNPAGLWSSWPHHDFDANPELAPLFEEVFLYFTKPGQGWVVQKRKGLFCTLDPIDDVRIVHNGDAGVMPLGDHPIVAGVDSQVLYIWFYVSPIPKVYARWAEDIGGYA